MKFISDDKTVKSNTAHDSKEFNSQSLATQTTKGEQLVCMISGIKNVFDLLGADIVKLSTEN